MVYLLKITKVCVKGLSERSLLGKPKNGRIHDFKKPSTNLRSVLE